MFSQPGHHDYSVLEKGSIPYKAKWAMLVCTGSGSDKISIDRDKKEISFIDSVFKSVGFQTMICFRPPSGDSLAKSLSLFSEKYGQFERNGLMVYLSGETMMPVKETGTERNISLRLFDRAENPGSAPDQNLFPVSRLIEQMYKIRSPHLLFISNAMIYQPDLFSTITKQTSPDGKLYSRQAIVVLSDSVKVRENKEFFPLLLARCISVKSDAAKDGFLTASELAVSLQDSMKIADAKGIFFGIWDRKNQQQSDFAFARIVERTGSVQIESDSDGDVFIDGENRGHVSAGHLFIVDRVPEGLRKVKFLSVNGRIVEDNVYVSLNESAFVQLFSTVFILSSNSLYPDVFVQGGKFNMGSNNGPPEERPRHEVTIDSLYMGKYEVTRKLWKDIMGQYPPGDQEGRCERCPVSNVSYTEALDFIARLNERTHLGYRLPTEAEWEYCARGGLKATREYLFSGSDTLGLVTHTYNNEGAVKKFPAGSKKPNELLLYDMTGNVAEWCSDWYSLNYYQRSEKLNPAGPADGTGMRNRVIRGGSSHDISEGQIPYITKRRGERPTYLHPSVGFRMVRPLKQ